MPSACSHLGLGLSLFQPQASQAGADEGFQHAMYPDNFTSLQIL
jgi:hypothetical protein